MNGFVIAFAVLMPVIALLAWWVVLTLARIIIAVADVWGNK